MNLVLAALIALLFQASASVDGVVVKLGSSEPLAEATVQLRQEITNTDPDAPRAKSYAVKTGSDGRFLFENVPPGTYRLIATRPTGGYVPAEYGQRTPTSQGVPLTVAPGQKLSGIQLAMGLTASIAGRIFDEDGEPVARAQVNALRSVYKDGRRIMTNVQTVETNDRGEYRLFWLAPGRYYISAKPDIPQLPSDPRNPGGKVSAVHITSPARFGTSEQAAEPTIHKRRLKTGEVVEETYIPVFYPGVTAEQGAAPIDVGPGAASSGVDMSVTSGVVPALHVRGRAIAGTTVANLAGTRIVAVPRAQTSFVIIPSVQTDSRGEFDLAGVAPGSYWLFASRDRMLGMAPVEIGNNNAQNIAIPMVPAFNLSGRFTFDGRSRSGDQPPLWSLRLAPLGRDQSIVGMPVGGPFSNPPPDDDGSFTVEGIYVGDFHVTVFGLPPDSYVKSMRLGDIDILDQGLHLTGQPGNLLNVVIGLNAGSIAGSVVGSRQELLADRTVVLVPDPQYRFRKDLYKVATTDDSGRFRIQSITPGDYTVFAWDEVESGAWLDPDFLRTYETRGTRVHITEGDNEALTLTVIP
ncbi:MAG TPA: carboxypeptidase-like regulatory domain-containing protein [Terriglobia bacterium]|jgi:protocatechuate 3,4-dioxygenase beta subunit